MPSSRKNQPVLKKKPPAKKQWKAVQSRPSATSATLNKKKTRLDPLAGIEKLKFLYPDAHCALLHENPFQLLVATILSAQCTDERVNMVTPHLFAKYPDAFALAKAQGAHLEEIIRSTGFYRNKAKNLIHCAQILVDKFKGEVPQRMEDLQSLGGVGRKTANVVLGNSFGIATGVVVDTHVTRLSNRFGWVQSENAEKIELQLMKIIPQEDWILISHLLIWHGRALCKARSPQCADCAIKTLCPKVGVAARSLTPHR